eukprot:scaffold3115_cov234-Pinguiococcus_pyrenoidosus.AAC.4
MPRAFSVKDAKRALFMKNKAREFGITRTGIGSSRSRAQEEMSAKETAPTSSDEALVAKASSEEDPVAKAKARLQAFRASQKK